MLDKMTEVEEAKLHMQLLREALKTKTEPAEYGPPELIAIDHDDYHAEHVGIATGCQFFLTTPFDSGRTHDSRREFARFWDTPRVVISPSLGPICRFETSCEIMVPDTSTSCFSFCF